MWFNRCSPVYSIRIDLGLNSNSNPTCDGKESLFLLFYCCQVNKLKDCIELICELLQQHHHRNQFFENRKTSQELIVKSRQIFIALSCFLVSFLEQLVSVEKVSILYILVPINVSVEP